MENVKDGNYLYEWGMFLLFLSVVWHFRSSLSFYIFQRMRAWIIVKFEEEEEKLFSKEKKQIFNILTDYVKGGNRNLTILDIGSGPAVNVAYIPVDSKLICLDPNTHFENHVYRKLNVHKSVKEINFVKGYAENMPFEDETFDAVLCTLAMCVFADLKQSLEEIKRVLKPGGKLIFLEHVRIADETLFSKMTNLMYIPIGWFLFGCHYNRDTEKHIKDAGFGSVTVQIIYPISDRLFYRKCIFGEATK